MYRENREGAKNRALWKATDQRGRGMNETIFRTFAFRPTRDSNLDNSEEEWSMVSKAADKSKRVTITESPDSVER